MRQLLSIALGVLAWAIVRWFVYREPTGITFQPVYVIDFLKVVQPNFLGMVLHLTPGLVAGLVATRKPTLCGAVAAALASFIQSAALIGHVTPDYHVQLLTTSVALAVVYSVYGMAGGALGSLLGGSNNSFKPKPLRGSA